MGLTSALAIEMRQQTARAEQAERDLALMTQRAVAAEAELRESERDLSDMAANSNRLHAIAEQMRQRAVAAEAKLAAIPWAELDRVFTPDHDLSDLNTAWQWVLDNKPQQEAQP